MAETAELEELLQSKDRANDTKHVTFDWKGVPPSAASRRLWIICWMPLSSRKIVTLIWNRSNSIWNARFNRMLTNGFLRRHTISASCKTLALCPVPWYRLAIGVSLEYFSKDWLVDKGTARLSFVTSNYIGYYLLLILSKYSILDNTLRCCTQVAYFAYCC